MFRLFNWDHPYQGATDLAWLVYKREPLRSASSHNKKQLIKEVFSLMQATQVLLYNTTMPNHVFKKLRLSKDSLLSYIVSYSLKSTMTPFKINQLIIGRSLNKKVNSKYNYKINLQCHWRSHYTIIRINIQVIQSGFLTLMQVICLF